MSYSNEGFLDQFTEKVQQQGEMPQAPEQGGADVYAMWQAQGYTPEQIQQYYQQYGYYDYSQYYGQAAAHHPHAADGYGYAPWGGDVGGGGGGGGGFHAPPKGSQEPTRSVWLGNIHQDTTEAELHASFSVFGPIESIKLLQNKNCAFVRFYDLDAAIQAHAAMSGQLIHGQQIKVGWGKAEPSVKEEVGPPACRNLWLGNISPEINEEQIRSAFSTYGVIEKVRLLPQKNCAFVNFASLESAIAAKQQMQGRMIGDRPVKINFGKETSGGLFDGPSSSNTAATTPPPSSSSSAPPEPEVEPPPPLVPEPADLEQKQVIDKICVFVERNGTRFADLTRERQKDNPKFAFLDPEHPLHGYYLLKLWCTRYPGLDPEQVRAKINSRSPPPPQNSDSPFRPSESSPPPHHQQHHYNAVPPPSTTTTTTTTSSAYPQNTSGRPPSAEQDELSKLGELIDNLVPTKDSIKVTKNFIMSRENMLRDISAYLRTRVESSPDFHAKLNIIYVINDVLHHSVRDRTSNEDTFSRAFESHLLPMFSSAFRNEPVENQEKLMKVLRIWNEKKIYEEGLLRKLEDDVRRYDGRRGGSGADDDKERRKRKEYDRDNRGGEREREHRSERERDRHDKRRR